MTVRANAALDLLLVSNCQKVPIIYHYFLSQSFSGETAALPAVQSYLWGRIKASNHQSLLTYPSFQGQLKQSGCGFIVVRKSTYAGSVLPGCCPTVGLEGCICLLFLYLQNLALCSPLPGLSLVLTQKRRLSFIDFWALKSSGTDAGRSVWRGCLHCANGFCVVFVQKPRVPLPGQCFQGWQHPHLGHADGQV